MCTAVCPVISYYNLQFLMGAPFERSWFSWCVRLLKSLQQETFFSRWRGGAQRNSVWCTLPCTNHYMMLCKGERSAWVFWNKHEGTCLIYLLEGKGQTHHWVAQEKGSLSPCSAAQRCSKYRPKPRLQLKWRIQKDDASRRKSGAKNKGSISFLGGFLLNAAK